MANSKKQIITYPNYYLKIYEQVKLIYSTIEKT